MAGIKSLIWLALTGSTGMTLLILACTLHQQNWWPAIVTLFYLACPFPILISKHVTSDAGFGSQSNPPKEWAYFLTTGIIISALALPIIMARVDTIVVAATLLSLASSAFFFSTILAFFVVFQSDDSYAGGLY